MKGRNENSFKFVSSSSVVCVVCRAYLNDEVEGSYKIFFSYFVNFVCYFDFYNTLWECMDVLF